MKTPIRSAKGLSLVMEFVEGKTLRSVLKDRSINLTRAFEIALQVAQALQAAHKAGVVHRDIKPENIMVRRDGYVKVLDFGAGGWATCGRLISIWPGERVVPSTSCL